MSNIIPPFSTATLTESSAAPANPAAPKAAPSANSAASQSEEVTLSASAQATTQLLDAARQSDGIDQAAVAGIRAALASGSYNVAPEDLAQAIATVLKETN
jgi:flagellar biosynthesis anti-sigma factor FlgM